MVRSMISYSILLINFWTEALKTLIHILNRVPSKLVPKTPYKLWTEREPSLNYLRVWYCLAEAKMFNPDIGKLDPKKVSRHFIGYSDKWKGYRFCCPKRHEVRRNKTRAIFLHDKLVSGRMVPREISLEEKRVHVPTLMTQEPFFSQYLLLLLLHRQCHTLWIQHLLLVLLWQQQIRTRNLPFRSR